MYALGYTQVATGAAALVLGPAESSYETLRVLTWLHGLAGALGVFALARRLGAETLAATAAAATLALNPLYTNLSFTFMSDVSFCALCTWSLYFWASPPERRVSGRVLALLFAAAATLSRQPGAALGIAYAISLAIPAMRTRRHWVVGGSILVAAAVLVRVAARATEPASRAAPFGVVGFAQNLLGPHAAYFQARHASIAFVYLGIFLAPLGLMVRPESGAHAGARRARTRRDPGEPRGARSGRPAHAARPEPAPRRGRWADLYPGTRAARASPCIVLVGAHRARACVRILARGLRRADGTSRA